MPTWPPSAVFLDRDGVLIENVSTYVRGWDEVKVFPRSVEAVSILSRLGVPLVVVTNQAIVGKGVLTLAHVTDLNRRILGEVEAQAGIQFVAAYICHHAPSDGCDCRKPLPGMLHRAVAEHGLDLSNAVMVGDAISDLLAGEAAGVHSVLVRTGRGRQQEIEMAATGPNRPVFDDLLDAVQHRFESH